MSGSKQTTTTEAKNDPWLPAQPVLNQVLGNVAKYGGNANMFRPQWGETTRQGFNQTREALTGPSNVPGVFDTMLDQAQTGGAAGFDTLMGSANGDMLSGNPYLDKVLATARSRAADAVNAQFAGAGRFGSGAHTGILADRLGQIETDARMRNYDTERGRQMQSAQILHGAGQNAGNIALAGDQYDLGRAQSLFGLGQTQDAYSAARRQAPITATQWMAGLGTPIAGLGGTQTSTQTTSTPANTMGMIGGGLMTGLGLLSGNPMMAMNGMSGVAGGMGGGAAGGVGSIIPRPAGFSTAPDPSLPWATGYGGSSGLSGGAAAANGWSWF